MSASLGWADLVRLRSATGDVGLDGLAESIGFVRAAESPHTVVTPDVAVLTKHQEVVVEHEPAVYWFADGFAMLQRAALPPESQRKPRQTQRSRRLPVPKTPSLVPRSALAGHLKRTRSSLGDGQVDLARLVGDLARGRVPMRLPRQRRRVSLGRIWVLLDRSRRLVPFWSDQIEVLEVLSRDAGDDGLRASVLKWGPHPPPGGDKLYLQSPWPTGLDSVPVLLLSDLGTYGSSADRRAWLTLGRRLARRGHPLHALLPVPRSRWSGAAPGLWGARVWDRSVPADVGGGDGRATALLKLLAPAVRIEPGLLRQARFDLLSADRADAGTEIDAWWSRHVETRWSSWLQLAPDVLAKWREEWSTLSAERRRQIATLIDRWHGSAPEEVGHLEMAIAETLAEGTVDSDRIDVARDFFATLRQASVDSRAGVESWLRGVRASVPDQVWSQTTIGVELTQAWLRHCGQHDEASAPANLSEVDRVGDIEPGEPRSWAVLQRGDQLEIAAFDDHDGRKPVDASVLVVFRTRYAHVSWGPEGQAVRTPLAIGACYRMPERAQPLVVEVPEGRWRLIPQRRPSWAQAIGRDRFGIWVDIVVAGVTQRMRWIPPGRFWMGSPEGEDGRYADEGPQHEVIVRSGYWLADTPVTQELWQALMGNNPSEFKSPTRPVENVSWDDATGFLKAVQKRQPELALRLPREWEWEHACRAGTVTSTWAGELEILGQNNAPLLDDIAWYGGNSGVEFEFDDGWDTSEWPEKQHDDHSKAGTHPVKGKRANPHGLYDMLGNVWEWCEDWHAAYTADRKVEPTLPGEGSYRVLRGGSWRSHAGLVRSADRLANEPGSRWLYAGFRLARGQAPGKAGAEPREEAQGEPGTEPRDEAEIPGEPARRSRPEKRRSR